MAKALNLGVTAWSPLSNGVLTVKYHGHGFSESGRMSSDMLKEFMPEEQKTAAHDTESLAPLILPRPLQLSFLRVSQNLLPPRVM